MFVWLRCAAQKKRICFSVGFADKSFFTSYRVIIDRPGEGSSEKAIENLSRTKECFSVDGVINLLR